MLTDDNIDAAYEEYMDNLFAKYNGVSTYALEQLAQELSAEGQDIESDEIFYVIMHR